MAKKLSLFVLILILTSCSYYQRNSHRIVSVTPSEVPETNRKNFKYSQQAYGGVYPLDPALSLYVNEIAQQCVKHSLHPDHQCTVVIVNSSIPNIWSFPVGYIAVTRGLLVELENEDELVGILCHEISHLNHRDGRENIQQVILNAGPVNLDFQKNNYISDFAVGPLGSGSGLLTLKYNVQAEVQADQSALSQMSQMGYSSMAVLNLQKRVQAYQKSRNPNWMGGYIAKHPLSDYQIMKCESCQNQYSNNEGYKTEVFENHLSSLRAQTTLYGKLDQGYKALLNNEYESAIQIANQGLAEGFNESHFNLLKGKAQKQMGNFATALGTLNIAVAMNPYYFDHYLQRGLVKEQLDDWADACLDLERSLALLPTAEAYYALGEIDYSKERQAEAIEYFRKASISASPGGKKALKKLKDLGLPVSGIQTLEVSSSFTETGHLNLEVLNKGCKIARSIVVDVEQVDPKGKLLYRYLIEIKKDLSPYEKVCQQTNIGPFFSEEHLQESIYTYPVYCE